MTGARRGSSCGSWRGETGPLSNERFEKYGRLPEKGVSGSGSSIVLIMSAWRCISLCKLVTAAN